VGLPFSPWFIYSKEAIYTPLAADAYRSQVTSGGKFMLPNWSAALAGVGVVLLAGRLVLQKSEGKLAEATAP
jgi:hypothetical protein